MDEIVETLLLVDDEFVAAPKTREELKAELRSELKEELRKELRQELKDELEEMARVAEMIEDAEPMKQKRRVDNVVMLPVKKEEVFPPGFLPRPNDNKVYAIGEDDYAFWDLLFGEGIKKEREKW